MGKSIQVSSLTHSVYSIRCPSCRLAESRSRCADVNDLNDMFLGNEFNSSNRITLARLLIHPPDEVCCIMEFMG
jgi:hypothetical protein